MLTEDEIEAMFWEFDARRKGYAQWAGAPQSERDAFKWTLRSHVRVTAGAIDPERSDKVIGGPSHDLQ